MRPILSVGIQWFISGDSSSVTSGEAGQGITLVIANFPFVAVHVTIFPSCRREVPSQASPNNIEEQPLYIGLRSKILDLIKEKTHRAGLYDVNSRVTIGEMRCLEWVAFAGFGTQVLINAFP